MPFTKATKSARSATNASSGIRKTKASKSGAIAMGSRYAKPTVPRASNISRGIRPSLTPDSSSDSPAAEIASSSGRPSIGRRRDKEGDGDMEEAVAKSGDERREARLPPDLLTRILHDFFRQDTTRVSRAAGKAVGKYMETFVREAIARAAYGRRETLGEGGEGGGWLEVEDLEKMAPQLILDF